MDNSDMTGERLIIFTRYPEPGKAKTRLTPSLGPEAAARLQREMTASTLAWAGRLTERRDVDVEVYFEGGSRELMQECFGTGLIYRPQGEGDLGRRMEAAFRDAFAAGGRRVVIVGCDCPMLHAELAAAAFEQLDAHDCVLGPAADGGYYLIGLRGESPGLFSGIEWGGSEVFWQTLRAAGRLGLSVSRLVTLADVDREEDLDVWDRVKRSAAGEPISVIVPALNEAADLPDALRPLAQVPDVETIVVDAGSGDATVEVARRHGAKVLRAPRGRAAQMNAGAAAGGGSILLFLHADTQLPEQFEEHVRRTLDAPGVAAGAFRLRVRDARGSLRLIQRAANLRARHLHMPYGDQAIFLRRKVFDAVGGFPELPIMEDFELVRRLRRRGRIRLADAAVVTSGRRWRTLGPWRTTVRNQLIVASYLLGVSPARLARWYRRR